MGERTVVKYITLATLGLRIASKMFSKIKEVKGAASPGGEKITFEEWVDISVMLQEEIISAIPDIDAYVVLVPKDQGWS